MKAAKGDLGAVKVHLAKFLLAYSNATHTTTVESPAMLLLGRGLTTCLDAVRPDTRKTVERRQAISVEQKEGKDRAFSVGEKVAVINYRDDQRWIAGIIEERRGREHMLCRLETRYGEDTVTRSELLICPRHRLLT